MTRLISLMTGIATLAACTTANAQDGNVLADLQKYCMQDAQQYCAAELANPEAVMQCLVDHTDKLSETCQPLVKNMSESMGLEPREAEKAAAAEE